MARESFIKKNDRKRDEGNVKKRDDTIERLHRKKNAIVKHNFILLFHEVGSLITIKMFIC